MVLTVTGHNQGQHYTGYTGNEGRWAGKREEGEKKRKSARALVLEKGKKKANLTDGGFPP